MSILIKGMEMPTSCEKCIYSAWSNFYQIYVCNAVRKDEPVLFDKKQVKSTATVRSNRADNCPLVPVPDHGRLIDADALIEKVIAKYLEHERKGEFVFAAAEIKQDIVDLISNAPTIIQADKEEEG